MAVLGTTGSFCGCFGNPLPPPVIFQRSMKALLCGLKGFSVFLGVTGSSVQEHLSEALDRQKRQAYV